MSGDATLENVTLGLFIGCTDYSCYSIQSVAANNCQKSFATHSTLTRCSGESIISVINTMGNFYFYLYVRFSTVSYE